MHPSKLKDRLQVENKLFTMEAYYDNVADLCISVRRFLLNNNVESHLCDAVEICLTEALNNVIKHAYKGESPNSIDVDVKMNEKTLEIKILDEGTSRESLVVKDLDFDPEDIDNLPESGMGLFIIKQLMDEIDYYTLNGKNYFTLRKYFY